MSNNFIFGDDDEEDKGRDPPITANDLKKQMRAQQKVPKKSKEEIEKYRKIQEEKQAAKKAKRGQWSKRGRQKDEEEKTPGIENSSTVTSMIAGLEADNEGSRRNGNSRRQNDEERAIGGGHKKREFSILNEIKDDKNFKAFLDKFFQLQKKSDLEGQQVIQMEKEDDFGNVEYKLKLANPSIERVEHLTTQMKFRLEEGNGQAFYQIGVEDSGNPLGLDNVEMKESLGTLFFMARNLNAQLLVTKVKKGLEGYITEVKVRRNELEGIKIDIKITMLGGEGAGKSTLIGVLISGKKDNGKGQARTNVFRHKHEILDGRTSSISQQILGFDSQGKVTNQSKFGVLPWAQIVEQSSKILTFIDVAGNERYAKTMIRGICSHYPDYALIVVDAKGLTPIAVDHFKLAFAFSVPVIIVITKIDQVSEDTLFDTKQEITDLIKQVSQKIPIVINNEEDVVLCSRTITEESICPLFQVSNLTFEGLDLFLSFLNLLPINTSNQWKQNQDDSPEFHITETFDKEGEPILSGMVLKGQISLRQQLMLGPDNDGRFKKVEIRGIHCKRVPVRQVKAGQMCSFAINLGKFADNWLKNCGGEIRKGMVLVDPKSKPRATWTFSAEIWTFDGTTKTIKNNYQPVVHTAHIRQSARMILDKSYLKKEEDESTKRATSIDEFHKSNPTSEEEEKSIAVNNKLKNINVLSSSLSPSSKSNSPTNQASQGLLNAGPKKSNKKPCQNTSGFLKESNPQFFDEVEICPNKKTKVILQFLYNPEYLIKDGYIIINENNLKAFGRITDLFYDTISKFQSNSINQDAKKKRKSSMQPEHSSGNSLINLVDQNKNFDEAYESPTIKKLKANRRTQHSYSMCITELNEEAKQQ